MHAVYLIAQIGPYGAARAKAARRLGASQGHRASVLELAPSSATYAGWDRPGLDALEVVTLWPRGDADRLPALAVSIRTWRALTALSPDVVFVPGWSDAFALAGLGWARAHRRLAVVMSESQERDAPRVAARELLKGAVAARFDAALVGGQTHIDYLARLGFPRERCVTPYDCVDNLHFASGAARARASLGALAPSILSVSRFVERKNLSFLVAAFRRYRRLVSAPWRLVVRGGGPLAHRLARETADLERAGLATIAPWASYAELPAVYAGAGVFVLPSTSEPWGLVVNEAMACGVPALVSCAAGSAELIESGRTGFTFDPTDERGLAKLLASISTGDVDAAALGRAAAQHLENYSPERFGEAFWRAATLASR